MDLKKKYDSLSEGQKVTFEEDGEVIDGIICVTRDGVKCIGNNDEDWSDFSVSDIVNSFGTTKLVDIYDYETANASYTALTSIKPKERKIEDGLKQGDIVENINGKRKVLGVCGEVYFMSIVDDFNMAATFNTLHEIIEDGYKLKQEEVAIPEYTVKELIEKIGHEFKIKE